MQWNTYGDLPNSELLRCFGHVDYLPMTLPNTSPKVFGNPGDVVEIRADVVVRCAVGASLRSQNSIGDAVDGMVERIDWWLEEGGDE